MISQKIFGYIKEYTEKRKDKDKMLNLAKKIMY